MTTIAPERVLPERPTLDLESAFWREGFFVVAGVDEVGRGALAGPLFAAAVVLPACGDPGIESLLSAMKAVRDSKLLSAAQREACVECIVGNAVTCALASVEADELDDIGVSAANRLAMERAVASLPLTPDALLLDARTIETPVTQIAPIKGDRLSLSIAAAGILAKVERDRVMTAYDSAYPGYGFALHKGYGTATHLRAIRENGPCEIHRRSFALHGRPKANGKRIP